jgi:hypothetical protein
MEVHGVGEVVFGDVFEIAGYGDLGIVHQLFDRVVSDHFG